LSNVFFGQVKSLKNEIGYNIETRNFPLLLNNQSKNFLKISKSINLNINQSLHSVYKKNTGFKKEIDYFQTEEDK
jgi:hypothetical protein